MHLGRKSISPSVLGVLTHAMESIFGIGADAEAPQHVYLNTGGMVEILRVYVRMCADGSSPECQRQAGQGLEVFTSSKEICKILVVCTEAVDILVGLINHKTPLPIVSKLTQVFCNIFGHGIDVEDDVNFDFINRVLENYIAIFTETIDPALKIESTRALSNFSLNKLHILEMLMKHLVAGEINTLVLLKLIDKHSGPLTVRVVGTFFYRILVRSEAVDVKLGVDVRANVIADVLKCFIGILVDGIQSQSRIKAVWILTLFAESEEIQKLLVVDSRVIEQVGGLLQEDVSSWDLRTFTDAIYNIYVLGAQVDLNDKVKLRVFTHILETFVGFLADEGMKLDMQREAVRGFELFGARDEIRKLLPADLRLILQDSLSRLLRVKLDVSPILVRNMANFLFFFFVKERKIEGKKDMISPVIQKALESFSRILMEDFKPEVQSEAIRGLGMLAARPDIRELIVGYKGTLKRSVELLRGTATKRILWNVHLAIEFLSAKGPDSEDLDENTAEFRSWALKGYISLLRDGVPTELQEVACRILFEILMFKDNRKMFALACPSGDKNLKFLLDREDQKSSDWPFNCGFYASAALTLIDPSEGIDLRHSPEGYLGRGYGHMVLGMFENASVDFNKALEIRPDFRDALGMRAAARLQLDNTIGALEDLDHVLMMKKDPHLQLDYPQERGIVKRIMGDFSGALTDLNKGLAHDPYDYEQLKHRGYVRFLMGDESACS